MWLIIHICVYLPPHGIYAILGGFSETVRKRLAETKSSPITTARQANLNRDAIRSVLRGRSPSVDRTEEICNALGLEFYIGPPRGDPDSAPPAIAEALGLPPGASIDDAVTAIDNDETAKKLRERMRLTEELMNRAEAAAALLPQLVREFAAMPERASVMMSFVPDVRLAAGTGEAVFEESSELSIIVSAEALAPWAQPDRLKCVRAVGDSMEPTIGDGDFVALDHGRTEPLDGQIFAARTATGLVVKRLGRRGDRWQLISDNPAYQSRPMTEDDRILGQVAWHGPPDSVTDERQESGTARTRRPPTAGATDAEPRPAKRKRRR